MQSRFDEAGVEHEYLLVFVCLLDLIVAEYGSDEVGPFLGVVWVA